MTTQITVIDAVTIGNDTSYYCIFWLTAPSNRVMPIANFVSRVTNVDPTILSALRAGTLVEQAWNTGGLPSNTPAATLKANAIAAYAAMQTALNATNPPMSVIGVTYNGTTWSA